MASLIHRIYTSVATRPFSDAELETLLARARRTNSALSVSGMLLYADGHFLQVLEGPPPAVDDVYARIARDTRHTSIHTIIREPIARRAFAEWRIGFTRLAPSQVADILRVEPVDVRAGLLDLDEARTRSLIQAFAAGRWRLAEGPWVPLPKIA